MSWAAFLAGLYLSAGASVMDGNTGFGNPRYNGGHWDTNRYWLYDINMRRNPYGELEAGWSGDLSKRFTFDAAIRHQSSIPAPDNGQDLVVVRVRFFPWRQQ